MSQFFKGWRRKIGVLTLVLALVAMAGWVRSKVFADQFDYATSATSCQIIFLLDGHLGWMIFQDIQPKQIPNFGYDSTQPFQTFDKFYNEKSKAWKWRFCGFAVGNTENPGKITIFVLSFWSIVIPLTLLSAYLLLVKPRKSTPIKITEPIPVEGT